jgi:hypothetical protein
MSTSNDKAQNTEGYSEPEYHDDPEVYLDRKLTAMKNTDLYAAAISQDGMGELMGDLSDEEKKQVELETREIAESYEDMLGWAAEALRDPEARKKILAELFQRV